MNPAVWAKDALFKSFNFAHRAVVGISGGRVGGRLFGMHALELEVIGRTSGQVRKVMLTTPIHDAQRTVIVASKGGDDRDPEWYRNLLVNPDVKITIDGATVAMRARSATAAEKAELWPQIVAAYNGYAGYQERTKREIPVVICEPVA